MLLLYAVSNYYKNYLITMATVVSNGDWLVQVVAKLDVVTVTADLTGNDIIVVKLPVVATVTVN